MSKKNQAVEGIENGSTSFKSACFKDKPVTRRSLLAQGMVSGVGYLALPSIIDLVFQRQAYGQDALVCKPPMNGNDVLPSFLQIELSGGWSAARNFAFGKQKNGGAYQPLAAASYATIGLGTTAAPTDPSRMVEAMVNGAPNPNYIGGPMVLNSNFLAGLIAFTTPEARAKMTIAAIAGISGDDTANNPLNVAQLAAQVVNAGREQLVQLVGTGGRPNTLGRTAAVDVGDNPALSKAPIQAPADALSLVDPGLLASRLTPEAVKKIADEVKRMSESQLMKFQQQSLSKQVADLVRCGYLGSKDLLGGMDASRIDPRLDPLVTALPGNPLANPAANPIGARVATIAKLLTDGMSAAGTIEIGGYDYHGEGLATQNRKDAEAGAAVGTALQIAHAKGVPMFIAVTSDGSVAAPAGGRPDATGRIAFSSDSGERGSILLLSISGQANTRAQMNHYQVGAFKDAGAVDAAYLPAMATTPRLQSIVVAANYAAFAGKMTNFRSMLLKANQEDFVADNIDYLAFKPRTA
jgi:hypothetical protein